MNAETYKREAAAGALDFVKPGMRLGLGTGSTARPFVELLGDRVRAGLDVDRGADLRGDADRRPSNAAFRSPRSTRRRSST